MDIPGQFIMQLDALSEAVDPGVSLSPLDRHLSFVYHPAEGFSDPQPDSKGGTL